MTERMFEAMAAYVRDLQQNQYEYREMYGSPEAREFCIDTAFEMLAAGRAEEIVEAKRQFLTERFGNAALHIHSRLEEGDAFAEALDDLCEVYWSVIDGQRRERVH